MSNNKNERISYSELKVWNDCAYKHKLAYVDNLKTFTGNEHTAFGSVMHHICEKLMVDEQIDFESIYSEKFKEEFDSIEVSNPKLKEEMQLQGPKIYPQILPAVQDYFQNYELVSVEEEIFETLDPSSPPSEIKFFKGFIDLVIKTPDGKHHIIDWKTCSWGWNREKKNDKILAYQLVLYKEFYSRKHQIPKENINTYFALLKRTAKNNNVEIFKVSSASRRQADSVKFLNNAIFNISAKNYIKNRLSCSRCEFHKTQHCP